MESHRNVNKDGHLKDLFDKTPVKKADSHKDDPTTMGGIDETTRPGEDAAPVAQSFLEQLLGVLREDFATLKQEIATELKNLRKHVGDSGQRVDSLEQSHKSWEEELDAHRQEQLHLRDMNLAMQYHMVDLDNRSQRSKITCLNTDRCTKRIQLETAVRDLETTHKVTGSLAVQRQLNAACKQLRALDMERAEYALLWAKKKYNASGNKVGLLLAQRLRSQALQQGAAALQPTECILLQQDKQIAAEFTAFYTTLYSAEEINNYA
ncbi:hypothetical protein NDU88_005433 [Pleurodeles waltl]|uniref:Uncharacterized protein n=1 Tax=Pleurodeles waltl TaxID=8319 RepID=A0AAV7SLS3_PLEWA|nr:hypothetical protein NDU88_005433 [Pleurodeles waltl]